ncbi:MAG: RagB/SusD family nutrient uptake outer membrane protein [Mediterranea sp.]|jgi:hypothetical protein|nr:RagB/SusD family nutrient uptake outer membrane protein [Mediterranea sp.]
MKTNKIKTAILLPALLLATACSDFLEPEDSRYVESERVADVLELTPDAIVQGIYSRAIQYAFYMAQHDDFGQKSLDLSVDFSAEDIAYYNPVRWFASIYRFEEHLANTPRPGRQWQYNYANIRDLNTILIALEGIDEVTLSESQRHLKGEALALRAFHYFQLINLFQTGGEWNHIKDLPGVPVYTTPAIEGGSRGKVSDVYDIILADYDAAVPLLAGYDGGKGRISQTSAQLLAARANLYAGRYDKALTYSSAVVETTSLMPHSEYTGGFNNISNAEWLWGVDVTAENTNFYASFFSNMDSQGPGYGGGLGRYKCIDRRLYDNIRPDDVRKAVFADATGAVGADGKTVPYLQLKFTGTSGASFLEDLVYLRSAEAYYIKAEAQVRTQGAAGIAAAQATLDIISNARATTGTHSYTWDDSSNGLLDQISIHKRFELWGEGQSAFEFNRLEKTIDRTYPGTNHPVGNITPGGDRALPWHDALRTLQIPVKELEGNPNITTADQNP